VPGLAVYTGLLILAQHVWVERSVTGTWPPGASIFLAASLIAALLRLFRARKGLIERLGSVAFSVAILIFLAVATALGTMTPQQPIHPSTNTVGLGGHLVGLLFLNDVFHSFWYGGLLQLLALALIVTVLQRPFWKPYFWGFLMAHAGMVLLIIGGAIGRWFGEVGRMPLRVGQTTDEFRYRLRSDVTERVKKLDFGLRLDAFDVEKYPNETPVQLLVFRMETHAGEHAKNPAPIFTTSLKEAGSSFVIPNTDFRVWVRDFYPDIEVTETMEESNNTDMPPAAEIVLQEGDAKKQYWLIGGFSPHMELHASDLDVEWGDLSANEWTERTRQRRPTRHWLTVPGNREALSISVGNTYPLPGGKRQVSVVAFYPDFRIDMETRQAMSVSNEPLNPALQIELIHADGKRETQYLFPGRIGSHMGKENALDLGYRYEAGEQQVKHLVRVDGLVGQLAYATEGREVLRSPFKPGQPIDLPLASAPDGSRVVQLTVLKVLAHAMPKKIARTRSQEPRNPGVRVEILRDGHEGASSEALLFGKEEYLTGVGPDMLLVMDTRKAEVKAWRSQVSVIRDDQVVASATIAVNAPFSFGGYTFFQSDANERDPDYSGLRVARDPGVALAFAGMLLASLGVTYTLYVRPRLRREDPGAKEAS
jgi:hypothetical protein